MMKVNGHLSEDIESGWVEYHSSTLCSGIVYNDTWPELRVTKLAYAVTAESCLLMNIVLLVMVVLLYAAISIEQFLPDINSWVDMIHSLYIYQNCISCRACIRTPLTDFMTTVDTRILTKINDSADKLHPQPAESISISIETCLSSVNNTHPQDFLFPLF